MVKDILSKLVNRLLGKTVPTDSSSKQPVMVDQELREKVVQEFSNVVKMIDKKEEEIATLRRKVSELSTLHQELEALTRRVDTLTFGLQQMTTRIPQPPTPNNQQPTPPNIQTPPTGGNIGHPGETVTKVTHGGSGAVGVFYIKSLYSLNPPAFHVADMKSHPEGCLFCITMTDGNNGTFDIVDNYDMHQVLLNAFTPLVTATSEYGAMPNSPVDIMTVESGVVQRQDNNLVIVKKQKVRIF